MEEKLNGNLGGWSFEPISGDIRIKDIISDIRIKTMYLGYLSINNLKGAINEVGMYKTFFPESPSQILLPIILSVCPTSVGWKEVSPKFFYLVYEFKEQQKTSLK